MAALQSSCGSAVAPTSPHAHDPGNRGHMPQPPVGDKATGETALYRLYDATGQLLYIGISRSPLNRWGVHAENHAWWSAVATYRLEWHVDRETAIEAERRTVAAEEPLHNVQYNPRYAAKVAARKAAAKAEGKLRRAAKKQGS